MVALSGRAKRVKITKTMKNEPFGLYTLKMARADSDRALAAYRSRQCAIVAANFRPFSLPNVTTFIPAHSAAIFNAVENALKATK